MSDRRPCRWEIAFHSVTAGGSEFAGDPEACVAYVRKRYATQHELVVSAIIARKDAEQTLAAARKQKVIQTASGASAIICGVMPNGCTVGYLVECSLPTGWTEEGREISGRADYDLPMSDIFEFSIASESGDKFAVSPSAISTKTGVVFSRSEVAKAFTTPADKLRCGCGKAGCDYAVSISRNNDGSVQVGCSTFSKSEVSKISQWAKAGSQTNPDGELGIEGNGVL